MTDSVEQNGSTKVVSWILWASPIESILGGGGCVYSRGFGSAGSWASEGAEGVGDRKEIRKRKSGIRREAQGRKKVLRREEAKRERSGFSCIQKHRGGRVCICRTERLFCLSNNCAHTELGAGMAVEDSYPAPRGEGMSSTHSQPTEVEVGWE